VEEEEEEEEEVCGRKYIFCVFEKISAVRACVCLCVLRERRGIDIVHSIR